MNSSSNTLLLFLFLICEGSRLNHYRLKCCKSIKISASCADECIIELTGLLENEDRNSSLCNPTERYEIDICLMLFTERRHLDSLKSVALERLRQEIGTVRPDHALKLHCCSKAIFIESSECPECHQCATLCRQHYGSFASDHHSVRRFETMCLSSTAQVHLQQCLREVDRPCQLGCRSLELDFCSSVVDEMTTLYSSCNMHYDAQAKEIFRKWMNNSSIFIKERHISVQAMEKCSGELFLKKALCDHTLGRCTYESHAALICRNDCIKAVASCLDNTNGSLSFTDIELFCKDLPFVAQEKHPCISAWDNWPISQLASTRVVEKAFPCSLKCRVDQVCLKRTGDEVADYRCANACTSPSNHRDWLVGAASIAVGETIVTGSVSSSLIFSPPQLQQCTCRWSGTKALMTDCHPFSDTASIDYNRKCPICNSCQLQINNTGGFVLLAVWFGGEPIENAALVRVFDRFTQVAVCEIDVHIDGISIMIRFRPTASYKVWGPGKERHWSESDARSVAAICDAEIQRWYVALSQRSARLLADPVLSQLRCVSLKFITNQKSFGVIITAESIVCLMSLAYFLFCHWLQSFSISSVV